MKWWSFIFFFIPLLAGWFLISFFVNVREGIADPFAMREISTSTKQSAAVAPSSSSRAETHPGFHGPTGSPHIIGPSGPPPNY